MRAITNRELPIIRDLLTRLAGVPNIKVAYASAKTIVKINNEIRDLELIKRPDPEFNEFNNLLEEVKKKWARKRASGEPATRVERIGDRYLEVYDIPEEDRDSYQLEAERLEKEYLETVNRQRDKEKNFEGLMDQGSTCEFHHVDLKDVMPLLVKDSEGKTRLTGSQFTSLMFLMKDPAISMEMIPEEISQDDMLTLVEYFDL